MVKFEPILGKNCENFTLNILWGKSQGIFRKFIKFFF